MALMAVADAQRRLVAMARPVASETMPLAEAAGRWTTTALAARRSQPSADLSAMDGYAIRFADLPGPWRVIGESAAGHPMTDAVSPGEAARIFTGAAVPPGADTVVVQEEMAQDGAVVRLTGAGPPAIGRHIRPQGMDFTAGAPLLAAGTRLTAARIALLAAAGHAAVAVGRRVRIAILATGDELRAPGDTLGAGQLPESNGLMLAAMLAGWPVAVNDGGIVPDRLDALRQAFARAATADIIVTSGGASVGDHDLVRPALIAEGGALDFWRIALRPGKPMIAGALGDAVLLGLPGNPVSAFVTAHLFLKPLIAAMAGAQDPWPQTQRAALGAALAANDQRQDYLRAQWHDGRVIAAPVQDSGGLATLAAADCLIVRPPHAAPAAAGDIVDILPLA